MRPMTLVAVVCTLAAAVTSCTTAPSTPEGRNELLEQSTAAMKEMSREDPDVESLVNRSHGYAMFPEVKKGGLVFGGAYGRGVVYEQKRHVGYADLTQGSFGLQLGGQSFSELIVFESKEALESFKQGRLDFSADASAVILKTGTAANARFIDGVAVIVRPIAGAMAEAAVGGQQVTYAPK